MPDVLGWPTSLAEIARIQSERKRRAVELARRAPFFRDRLAGIDLDRLDDPAVWAKIPLLTKDQLRQIPAEQVSRGILRRAAARRGRILALGRRHRRAAVLSALGASTWSIASAASAARSRSIGATPDDLVHVSFPLGIHPVAHLYARAAEDLGIGDDLVRVGQQYAIAECSSSSSASSSRRSGPAWRATEFTWRISPRRTASILQRSSVRKIIVAAEPLSPAKRQKLERSWGAEVSDQFGMTEGALVSVQAPHEDGLRMWSDLFCCEVVDEATGEPVPEGKVGALVITPLFNNNVTPFLRWYLRRSRSASASAERRRPAVVDLPGDAARAAHRRLLQGARRQHQSLRAGRPDVLQSGRHRLQGRGLQRRRAASISCACSIEPRRGVDAEALKQGSSAATFARSFEVTPEIAFLEPGTIGKEFEASIKAARFVDRRG